MTTRARYDCSRCPGYCCSHPRIEVTENDITRIAEHFGVSTATAKRRYTYHYRAKEADEQVLRRKRDTVYASVCRFFDTDQRRCTIYQARPHVCRRYPYGNRCGYYGFLEFERVHQGDDEFIPTA